jgi:8-oxo-dGTP diphosphatase
MILSEGMLQTFGEQHVDCDYRPRPAVYAVIRGEAGQVALVREWQHLFLPGGGIEAGEDLEMALRREVREECCRTIHIEGLLGEALQYFSVRDRHYASHGTYFVACFTGQSSGTPAHELVWLDPYDAAATVFHRAHRWAIETAIGAAKP